MLVLEDSQLAGIITPKDLLMRVVAKGLDPDTTPVSDVMTPNPDTVPPDMTVMEALREASALDLLISLISTPSGVSLLNMRSLVTDDSACEVTLVKGNVTARKEKLAATLSHHRCAEFWSRLRKAWRQSMPNVGGNLTHFGIGRFRRIFRLSSPTCVLVVVRFRANMLRYRISWNCSASAVRVICSFGYYSICCCLRLSYTWIPCVSCSLFCPVFQMHENKYLHLPVVDEDRGMVEGVVNVMEIVQATAGDKGSSRSAPANMLRVKEGP